MTRRLKISLLLLLAAGAMVNVVVAWGCAITLDVWRIKAESSEWASVDLGDGRDWVIQKRDVPGARVTSSEWHRYDPQQREPFDDDVDESIRPYPHPDEVLMSFERRAVHPETRQIFNARGWPLLSMWCLLRPDIRDTQTSSYYGGGIAVTEHPYTALPLIPIWSGFIINTLLYAVLLSPIALLVGRVRGMARRHTGRVNTSRSRSACAGQAQNPKRKPA